MLGLKRDSLSRYTGAVCAIQGWVTAWVPALLLLTGSYGSLSSVVAVVLAVFGVVVFGALYVVMVRRAGNGPSTAVTEEQHAPA